MSRWGRGPVGAGLGRGRDGERASQGWGPRWEEFWAVLPEGRGHTGAGPREEAGLGRGGVGHQCGGAGWGGARAGWAARAAGAAGAAEGGAGGPSLQELGALREGHQ